MSATIEPNAKKKGRGGPREGQGRPAGLVNRGTDALRATMKEISYQLGKVIPGMFEGDAHALLIAIYKDPRLPIALREDAAKAALRVEKPTLPKSQISAEVEMRVHDLARRLDAVAARKQRIITEDGLPVLTMKGAGLARLTGIRGPAFRAPGEPLADVLAAVAAHAVEAALVREMIEGGGGAVSRTKGPQRVRMWLAKAATAACWPANHCKRTHFLTTRATRHETCSHRMNRNAP